MKMWIAPYRLKFKRPFGTAHGFRDGTDCVFVKLERQGVIGRGEATLPPYVKETPASVIADLESVRLEDVAAGNFKLDPKRSPAARAALSTAYFDLIAKEKGIPVKELLQTEPIGNEQRSDLITLGITDPEKIIEELHQLPPFNALKVKLNGEQDEATLRKVIENDHRPILIDANQAWGSVEHALRMIEVAGTDRLLGIEQPFPVDRRDLQAELSGRTTITVYGDESIKDLDDLDRTAGSFSGINVKLMKCGGLDRAAELIRSAKEHGMKVMLGSMSESSLGCGALLQMAGGVDLIDLDGPWLIANDPFAGIELWNGQLVLVSSLGSGITERSPSLLNWTPIGT